MILSAAHETARETAARWPALQASLTLLTGANAAIRLYDAAEALIGVIPLADPPGALDADLFTLTLTTPVEGVISGAGPIASADLRSGDGGAWGAVTVSAVDDGGELQFETLDPAIGTFARLVSAVFQG